MTYVDATLIAVPTDKKDEYLAHARQVDVLFMDHGALSVVDSWGDDIPDGKITDFKRAVLATAEEMCLGWIVWPDKATRDAAWEKIMKDERMATLNPPYDGKRMIFGAFQTIHQL